MLQPTNHLIRGWLNSYLFCVHSGWLNDKYNIIYIYICILYFIIYIYYIILKILLLYKYYWIVVDRPHKKAQGLTETFSSVPDLETSHALASTGWSRDKRSVMQCSASPLRRRRDTAGERELSRSAEVQRMWFTTAQTQKCHIVMREIYIYIYL